MHTRAESSLLFTSTRMQAFGFDTLELKSAARTLPLRRLARSINQPMNDCMKHARTAIYLAPGQDLHLAAMEKLEHELSTNEKNASRALRERLQAARAAREAKCVWCRLLIEGSNDGVHFLAMGHMEQLRRWRVAARSGAVLLKRCSSAA